MRKVCRILIVEDDEAIRDTLANMLGQLGHTVRTAATLEDGAAQLDGQTHLILGVRLADGEGIELLQRVRREGRPRRVAVFTGKDMSPIAHRTAVLSADLLIPKPMNFPRLLDWLHDPSAP